MRRLMVAMMVATLLAMPLRGHILTAEAANIVEIEEKEEEGAEREEKGGFWSFLLIIALTVAIIRVILEPGPIWVAMDDDPSNANASGEEYKEKGGER